MQGITILEENIGYNPNPFCMYLIITGMIGLIVSLFILLEFDLEEISTIILTTSVITFLSGMLLCVIIKGPPSGKATYIVRIEEKIDLNELLNNYEILEHEKYSNIYKIRGDVIEND